jgi:hypothetical protein
VVRFEYLTALGGGGSTVMSLRISYAIASVEEIVQGNFSETMGRGVTS